MSKNHFQKHCEQAIAKIPHEAIEKFKTFNREEERIKLMYPYARSIPINVEKSGKSYQVADSEKIRGNKLFASRSYNEAINAYNKGIIQCPQDSKEGQELLAILISNRSASFFEKEQYKNVFEDIDYVLSIGSYPQRLHYKIWLRKAKCYDALQNERYAKETYELAISSLKHAELDDSAYNKKLAEIENSRNKHCPKDQNIKDIIAFSNADVFTGGNQEFVSAHKDVYFDFDPLLGRYARALENIATGVILVEENPHCAVISHENALANCQYCCSSTIQPIACPSCGNVVFCSLNCERQANLTFHKLECRIQAILRKSGASINCQMALRMISQRPAAFFQQKTKVLKDFLKDGCKKMPLKNAIYKADDYNVAFFLCRNEQQRKKDDLLHFSAMAIYLLRLLKFSDYFGKVQDEVLSEEESFVGSLLLRHLQILQFNSHEISEIRNNNDGLVDGIETFYKSESIGAGLYPTLALFNHSCDPSIIRYHVGNRIVARTIKPIKAGDIIYENYGPMYTSERVQSRRALLKERYLFDCYCTPCQDEWPLFRNMDPNQIKIGCQTDKCPFELTLHKDDFVPILQCDYCNNITKVFPCLKGLTELAILLPKAEQFYSAGSNREAMKLFMQALDILYKHSRPPCPDMVKVQQRLRTLLVHLGNKQHNYVQAL